MKPKVYAYGEYLPRVTSVAYYRAKLIPPAVRYMTEDDAEFLLELIYANDEGSLEFWESYYSGLSGNMRECDFSEEAKQLFRDDRAAAVKDVLNVKRGSLREVV